MPYIGEIRKADEAGKSGYNKYIWFACPECGKARWVPYIHKKPRTPYCRRCTHGGDRNIHWAGGRTLDSKGYAHIKLKPLDTLIKMANCANYILEHRLVMAKHLGRILERTELIHHINGDKLDNRIENLKLVTNGTHSPFYKSAYDDGYKQGYADGCRFKEVSFTIS